MKNKTLTIILAVVACVALIVSCVFGFQKGDMQKTIDATKAELTQAKADAETKLTEAKEAAAKELEAAKSAQETALTEAKEAAAKELESARSAAEATLTEAKAAAQKELDATKASLESVTAELETTKASLESVTAELETAKADLETAKADAETAKADLETAKADAETKLAAAEKATEAQVAEAKAAAEEAGEARLAEAQAAAKTELDAANAALAEVQKELDAAKAELETTKTESEAKLTESAEAASKELETVRAELKTAKEGTETQLAEAAVAAAAELEAVQQALQARITELEKEKAELEAKLETAQRNLAAAQANAYLMFANADWSLQNWGTYDAEDGAVKVTPANVTGEGDYTVGLEFATESAGLAFTAIGIKNGELDLPGYFIRLNEIRVNGEKIETTGVGYTSSDDGRETRMNLYNEWVTELPTDARCFDGNLAEARAIVVDKEAFGAVKTLEVDFSVLAKPIDHAYIMYADEAWALQNWGITDSEDGQVKVKAAEIRGAGDYTVGLEFENEAKGLAFIALGVQRGEVTFPNYYLTIQEIRVNGEKIEPLQEGETVKKGYTSSDNQIETRMNIYNEWVTELPADARRLDGDLNGAAPIWVDKAAFASVKSVEIDFNYSPISAYLMYANSDWSVQNWGYTSTDAVTVTSAGLTGEGTYTVALDFAQPSEGLAFAAVGIKNGETVLPGYIVQVDSVTVNGGEDNLRTGISYTNSDDGLETRANIYNEWVTTLPADARTEGDLANVSPIIVDPAAFTGVEQIVVSFRLIKGEEPAQEEAADKMTPEEAEEMKAAGFHAYIGVQGKDTYVFRNAWNDAYGLNDTENPFFNRLTGWDEANNAVDYGGTFQDTEIRGDGTYTVSMTTGEMGFGKTEAFNLLFVSTDIPSRLVKDGYLTLSDVQTKIGGGASQAYTEIDTKGDYAMIKVIDTYNQAAEPFGYTVPGANEDISVTFTVSGW